MERQCGGGRRVGILTFAVVAVLLGGAAVPALAADPLNPIAPANLVVSDAEGQPVPAINHVNAAPGDTEERTWFVTLVEGTNSSAISFIGSGFTDTDLGCSDPETKAGDTTCDPAVEGDGELAEAALATLKAGTVADDATSCTGPDVAVIGEAVATSTLMNQSHSIGDGTIDPGERMCVNVALNVPATAGNEVQSDQLAFNLAFNVVPAADPPPVDPPPDPEEPPVDPPPVDPADPVDPVDPVNPRPEPPPSRTIDPRPTPPLAATGLGLVTLLMSGAALVTSGAVVVKRSRARGRA